VGRFLYTVLLYLLLPRTFAHLWSRARKQPAYRQHWGERFGRYRTNPGAPLIWVHAVSVGETRAAAPLIAELTKRYPGHRILITHMTPTGRETGESLFGDRVERCYLPYDFPFAVARFLEHFKPVCGIVLETEIWPNLIHGCRRRGLPIYLVNARMSEKSRRGYARFKRFVGSALRELSGIAAQSTADADRLRSLGADAVCVTGNLKFDITPDPQLIARGERWRAQWARPVLLCASTREGEEDLLLPLARELLKSEVLVLIVPRHPQRFDEVAHAIERSGLASQRRSAGEDVSPQTRILLGDSMGEMFAYYAASDVAIIGGSLLPFGAQNLIEACAAGCPVVVGPHDYNFTEAVELAREAGAAVQVSDARSAIDAAASILNDAARRQTMSEAGLRFARDHRGAASRIADLVKF
jgi:3-deoxy-D-manno-octulosonic-acid transferase